MNSPQNFADVDTARKIVDSLYPKTQITMIEHSADNIVALVDTSYAVRFPRNKNAYLRGQYEKHILKHLEGVKTITIPRILDEGANPPYAITSFVPGDHISSANVSKLNEKDQQDFARSVARFAYTMHGSFVLDDELKLRSELGLDELEAEEPWPIYFKRVVRDVVFPTAVQDVIAKKYYADWVRLCDVSPTVVVHDDLHTENMMFNENHLVGVLDFGDTNLGTPEQELRQLYRISEKVMLEAVNEYQRLSGLQLNIEAIMIWSVMKELADYIRRINANDTSHHSFKRTSRNLNTWLPKGEWGKGYDLISLDDYQ